MIACLSLKAGTCSWPVPLPPAFLGNGDQYKSGSSSSNSTFHMQLIIKDRKTSADKRKT